jgi:cytosine deaminase
MDPFMVEALAEARQGLAEGGVPIGAVLVRDGVIIGRGHNGRVQEGNPILHAEIACLRNAGRIGDYRNTVLYSTCMPCFLCGGAVVQFGIPRVVAGEARTGRGSWDWLKSHGVEVVDLDLDECWQLMQGFVGRHPALWAEDCGAFAPR